MPRVVHFEIQAENPQRAVAFYKALFGWECTSWGGPSAYWLVNTGEPGEPGINGGLLVRNGPRPADGQSVNAYVCTTDVKAIDESIALLNKLGGSVVVPKMAVPGIGWLVYAKDTEGNIFGMMQNDPAAR